VKLYAQVLTTGTKQETEPVFYYVPGLISGEIVLNLEAVFHILLPILLKDSAIRLVPVAGLITLPNYACGTLQAVLTLPSPMKPTTSVSFLSNALALETQ